MPDEHGDAVVEAGVTRYERHEASSRTCRPAEAVRAEGGRADDPQARKQCDLRDAENDIARPGDDQGRNQPDGNNDREEGQEPCRYWSETCHTGRSHQECRRPRPQNLEQSREGEVPSLDSAEKRGDW